MATTIQKHYRFPEDIIQLIENRDKNLYPSEIIYIITAVRAFSQKGEVDNIMDELGEIHDRLDEIMYLMKAKEQDRNNFEETADQKEMFGKPEYLRGI